MYEGWDKHEFIGYLLVSIISTQTYNDYRKKLKSFYKCKYDLAYVLSVWVKIAGVESEWILKILRQTASNKCG